MDFWARIALASGILGLGLALVSIFGRNLARKLPLWASAIGFGSGIVFSAAGIVLPFVLSKEIKPDVEVRLVRIKSPDVQFMNTSSAVATNIDWQIVAFNLTRFEEQRQ